MIKTFRNVATADIARGESTKLNRRLLPTQLHRNTLLKMALLNRARTLGDLHLPGLCLEKLKADREGQYSLRINDQYRICFTWRKDGIYEVEVIDYHS